MPDTAGRRTTGAPPGAGAAVAPPTGPAAPAPATAKHGERAKVSAMSGGDAAWLRDLIRKRSAIVLDESKQYLLDTRLAPVIRAEKLSSVGELVSRARNGDRRIVELIVDAMTTNETSWFRDGGPFEALQADILPYLARARSSRGVIRIWSAACSSGQEAYSTAIVCREVLPPTMRVEIVGTDLSPAMVAKAAEGRYSQLEVNRGLPAPRLVRWMTRAGMHWQVSPELRAMTRFRQANLAEPFRDLGTFDLVFLRNVLIYFDAATKTDILQRARAVVADDGFLLLGAAETALGLDTAWQRERLRGTAALRPIGAPAVGGGENAVPHQAGAARPGPPVSVPRQHAPATRDRAPAAGPAAVGRPAPPRLATRPDPTATRLPGAK